ncbi:MAG: RES family NAD+ phosphorylase [Cyclobacteriaceae bacterium]
MILYHLDRYKYRDAWPPRGSLYGEGRWNRAGQWVIYCSPSIALAKLEILANESYLPVERVCMTIEVSGQPSVYKIKKKQLPNDWFAKPYPKFLHLMTRAFLESDHLLMEVPSAQSHREHNYLIKVDHPRFNEDVRLINVLPEPFDDRLKQ